MQKPPSAIEAVFAFIIILKFKYVWAAFANANTDYKTQLFWYQYISILCRFFIQNNLKKGFLNKNKFNYVYKIALYNSKFMDLKVIFNI